MTNSPLFISLMKFSGLFPLQNLTWEGLNHCHCTGSPTVNSQQWKLKTTVFQIRAMFSFFFLFYFFQWTFGDTVLIFCLIKQFLEKVSTHITMNDVTTQR